MHTNNLLVFFCLITLSISAAALENFGMIPVEYKDPKEAHEIENVPRVRSQDSLGLCYSFVASTLIDAQTCVDKKIPKCSEMPDDLRVSPLDVARFNGNVKDGDSSDREGYNGIKEGGSLERTLRNALDSGLLVSEKCAPYNQIVAKNSDPRTREQIETALWKRMKDLQNKYKSLPSDCVDCNAEFATAMDDIRKDFSLKASNQEILEAFAQDSFAISLDKMLVPDHCRTDGFADINPKYKVAMYPDKNLPKKDDSYANMISQIKKVLGEKKVPIGVIFCAQEGTLKKKSMADCSSDSKETAGQVSGFGHGVTITGYRKVCKKDNPKNCYDALRIQNSWGKQWQDEHNDGWVDGKELIKRTFYEQASLTWLESTKK